MTILRPSLLSLILCDGLSIRETATALMSPPPSVVTNSCTFVGAHHQPYHLLGNCLPSRNKRRRDHPTSYPTSFLSRSASTTSCWLAALSSSDSDTGTAENSRQLARDLYEANTMPPIHDINDGNKNVHNNSQNVNHDFGENHSLGQYDGSEMTPLESEFNSLMSTFLTYSERDIQSLTTTSSRYLNYQQLHSEGSHKHSRRKTHTRSKEEGIRYRALYSGVQSASTEPAVLRSFSVLFEDYLPIRLAGRRIYRYLDKVMKEIRDEREGEVARARDVCAGWDWNVDDETTASNQYIIEYAHCIWDTIMDESLLLDHSLESDTTEEQSQEGGIISLPQLMHLGIDQVLIESKLVPDVKELETLVRRVALEEDAEMDERQGNRRDITMDSVQEDAKYLELTFVSFMRMLHECTSSTSHNGGQAFLISLFQRMEQQSRNQRDESNKDKDTSILLASKAIHSGNSNTCKNRQKNSDRFNEYVSTFRIWEQKFISKDTSTDGKEKLPSRRLDILRGCFVGARNAKVVAALKIVYMDYAALRLAGDLIFRLMSKIVG